MAEVRIGIQVTGAAEAAQALNKVGLSVQEAGKAAEQSAASVAKLSQQQRAALAATRDLSQLMFASTQVLRLVGKENAALQDTINKIQNSFTLAAVALNIYRNAAQLAAGATTLLTVATRALLGPIGLVVTALGALTAVVGAAVVVFRRKQEAAKRAADTLAIYEAQANRSAAATEQIRHAQREGQLTAVDFAKAQELGKRALDDLEKSRAAEKQKELADANRKAAEAARKAEEAFRAMLSAAEDVGMATAQLIKDLRFEVPGAQRAAALPKTFEELTRAAKDAGRSLEGVYSEARRGSVIWGENVAALDAVRQRLQATADAIGDFRPNWDPWKQAVEDAVITTEEQMKRARNSIASALSGILTGTGTFGDLWTALWKTIVDRIIEEILRLKAVQAAISGILSFVFGIFGITGPTGGGGGGGGIQFLQRGGQIVAMRPLTLTIAERGPEQATIQPLANPQVARVVLAARPTPLVVGQRPERVTVTPLPAGTPIPPRGLQSVVTDLPTPRVRLVTPLQPLNPPALATLSTLGRGAFGIPTGVALPGVSGPRLAVQPSVPTVVAGAPAPTPRFERPEREIQEIFSTGGGITGPTGGGGGGGGIQFLQRGGEILAVRPTAIVAGERGPERVRVEPAAGPAVGGPVTIIFQGPTFVDDLTWSRMRRQLVDTLRDPAGLLWRRPGG